TVFGRTEFDVQTGKPLPQKGSGGKVIAIRDKEGVVSASDLVVGLDYPHKIVYLGEKDAQQYFMLTDTGRGRVQVYCEAGSWHLVGEIAFDSLPKHKYRNNEWLQSVTPTIDRGGKQPILTAYDSSRRIVEIVDLAKRQYQTLFTG